MIGVEVPQATVEQILVYLDGSPLGEIGVDYAMAVARATGASILLLNVVDSSPAAHPRPVDALGIGIARTQAAQYLDQLASHLAEELPGDSASGQERIRTEISEGRAADQILQIADREKVDLIVLTSHEGPDTRRFQMGSTTQKVAQHATQSLLVVRAEGDRAMPHHRALERALVLLDGSIAAESSLPSALELARTMGTEIVLAHILVRPVLPTCEPPTKRDRELLTQLENRSRELGRAYLRNLERGLRSEAAYCRAVIKESESIRQGVLAVAEEEDVDIILLTSHGHTSSENVVHGGVTQQVLMHASRPVWVVQNLHVATQQSSTIVHSQAPQTQASGPL